ncbi:transporter [Streptomyces sp. NPDC005811]|uniref:transporter n=1 Tax=Streptomyces sp. NPDC005811 TaxID=3154565 RepID=UPI0033C23B7B
MTWLTWRQLRAQATVWGGCLAVLAAVLAVTGPRLAGLGDPAGLVARTSATEQALYYGGLVLVLVLPALVGMFWGAPLIARELETGTHRLVWNQSVSRTRWLLTRLSLTALAAMTVAGLGSLAVSWWSGPIDGAAATGGSEGVETFLPRLHPLVFAARGIVPVGGAAFAFVLGATLGVVFRRTLPAMAATLGLYVGVQLAVPFWIRPHLAPAERATVQIDAEIHALTLGDDGLSLALDRPGAWITGQETVDAAGHPVTALPSSVTSCRPPSPPEECLGALTDLHYRQRITYQPAGHFWRLQWAETGLYCALALALAGLCVWWVRRRPS